MQERTIDYKPRIGLKKYSMDKLQHIKHIDGFRSGNKSPSLEPCLIDPMKTLMKKKLFETTPYSWN
jgi:hypothetical protein